MAVYRRIREVREDHDLTQREIADELGMSQPQYNRYERGYRDIPTDMPFFSPTDTILRSTTFWAEQTICFSAKDGRR